jgi:hypothetical protein
MELSNAVLGDVPMLVATGVIDRNTCGALQAGLNRLSKRAITSSFWISVTSLTSIAAAFQFFTPECRSWAREDGSD